MVPGPHYQLALINNTHTYTPIFVTRTNMGYLEKTKQLTSVLDKVNLLAYFEKAGITPKEGLVAAKFYVFLAEVSDLLG